VLGDRATVEGSVKVDAVVVLDVVVVVPDDGVVGVVVELGGGTVVLDRVHGAKSVPVGTVVMMNDSVVKGTTVTALPTA
jgi:hypothetical protein